MHNSDITTHPNSKYKGVIGSIKKIEKFILYAISMPYICYICVTILLLYHI